MAPTGPDAPARPVLRTAGAAAMLAVLVVALNVGPVPDAIRWLVHVDLPGLTDLPLVSALPDLPDEVGDWLKRGRLLVVAALIVFALVAAAVRDGRKADGGSAVAPSGEALPAAEPEGAIVTDYEIVRADDVDDPYAGTTVPGEFRSLTEALGCEQLAVTLIRIPPHSDFEQGTGHFHDEVEEIYIVTRGTLVMRLGDDVRAVSAGTAVRVAARTPRSHRNEGDEPVDMWALSRRLDHHDAHKLDDFWQEASPDAARERPAG